MRARQKRDNKCGRQHASRDQCECELQYTMQFAVSEFRSGIQCVMTYAWNDSTKAYSAFPVEYVYMRSSQCRRASTFFRCSRCTRRTSDIPRLFCNFFHVAHAAAEHIEFRRCILMTESFICIHCLSFCIHRTPPVCLRLRRANEQQLQIKVRIMSL